MEYDKIRTALEHSAMPGINKIRLNQRKDSEELGAKVTLQYFIYYISYIIC
jgi:hypothetical protein